MEPVTIETDPEALPDSLYDELRKNLVCIGMQCFLPGSPVHL